MMTPRSLIAASLALILAAPSAFADDEARPVDPKAQAAELIAAFKSDSPELRVKAVQAAKDNQHSSLTSPLVKMLSDKEWGVREAAMEALAAREDKAAKKKASSSIASRLRRLSKDPDATDELLQAIDALGTLAQPAAVKPLLDDITLETDIQIVRARFMAVAEIPDKKAIEGLIDFLAKGRRGGAGPQRDAARKALQYATGADAPREHRQSGKDADRWRAWWRENEKHFDFEAVKAARAQAEAEAAAKAERKREQKEKREQRKRDKESRGKKKQGGGDKPQQGDGA